MEICSAVSSRTSDIYLGQSSLTARTPSRHKLSLPKSNEHEACCRIGGVPEARRGPRLIAKRVRNSTGSSFSKARVAYTYQESRLRLVPAVRSTATVCLTGTASSRFYLCQLSSSIFDIACAGEHSPFTSQYSFAAEKTVYRKRTKRDMAAMLLCRHTYNKWSWVLFTPSRPAAPVAVLRKHSWKIKMLSANGETTCSRCVAANRVPLSMGCT